MISDDLKLLFGRDEVTVMGTEAIINKWHPRKKAVKIDYTVISYLVLTKILVEDSGNFYTGETHYFYDHKRAVEIDLEHHGKTESHIYDALSPYIRDKKLKQILNLD